MRDLEERVRQFNLKRLMVDEQRQVLTDLIAKSLELFGIDRRDTYHDLLPDDVLNGATPTDWEAHFEFLDYEYDDEQEQFWSVFGLDLLDDKGEPLECLQYFDRQLVCAVRQLHPKAGLNFRQDSASPESLQGVAEAWGRRLLDKR